MKAVSHCSLCLLKLAHTAAQAVEAPEPQRLAAVKAALEVLARDEFSRIPPAIAGDVLEAVNRVLGVSDPFAEIKAEHDERALELVEKWAPAYLGKAATPEDRLLSAMRAALAGNGLDLATIPEQAQPERFEKWLEVPWAVNHFEEFNSDLADAKTVLYLCDNAGEVAFDKVLIQELLDRGKQVVISVKGGPALNDATMEDARRVGLDRLSGSARLITTGRAEMGVDLARAAPDWREQFDRADLVIAKGQANLESLHDAGRTVYFITLIKCSHVADHYGLAKGSAMLLKGGSDDRVAPA